MDPVFPQVVDKRRVDICLVLVGDFYPDRHIFHIGPDRREQAQRRREQKKPDPAFAVPADDFRQNGKRRVVHHDAPFRILFRLVIPARIERPHERFPADPVFLRYPVRHRVVNVFRRVAVVRGFRFLELVQEGIVFVISFLPLISVLFFPAEPVRRAAYVNFPEPGQADVEPVHFQVVQFDPDQLRIPSAHFGQPVVRQNVGPALFLAQSLDKHARDRFHADLLRRHDPPVPGDHVHLAVNQAGRQEPQLLNAPPDSFDLFLCVLLCVPLVGFQIRDFHVPQFHRFSHFPLLRFPIPGFPVRRSFPDLSGSLFLLRRSHQKTG